MASVLTAAMGVLDVGLLQGLVLAGLAFSVALSLLVLDFPDLSIEGTFPLGAAVTAVLLAGGFHPLLVMLAAAGAGACGGVLTGILHVRFGMSKLLSGICTAAIFYTLNMWIMGNRGNLPVLDVPTYFSWFDAVDIRVNAALYGSRGLYLHPGAILACLLIVIVVKIWLDSLLASEVGLVLRGLGQNEAAVRYHGRNPDHYKPVGLALANALASLSGAVAAQYQGFSDVNMGVGVLVMGLVAVILGQEVFARLGLSTSSPRAMSRAVLSGVVVHQVLLAALLRAGAPPTSLRLLAGLSLVAVVAMRRRRKALSFSW